MTNELYLKRDDVLNLFEEYQPRLATHVYEFGEALKDLKFRTLESQPCEDAISREEVNDLVDELIRTICDEINYRPRNRSSLAIMHDISNLPPVTPKPKVGHWNRVIDKIGHWVWECDKCGWQQRINTNYCPDCGADMRGDADETNN